jgi:hypothetical protein
MKFGVNRCGTKAIKTKHAEQSGGVARISSMWRKVDSLAHWKALMKSFTGETSIPQGRRLSIDR